MAPNPNTRWRSTAILVALREANIQLIAGLIPAADGPMASDMRQALDERREMIEARTDGQVRLGGVTVVPGGWLG